MSQTAPPEALKLARPAFLVGALLLLAGAVVYREIIVLEPRTIWTICLMVPGAGFIIFGFTVTAAGRALAALQAQEAEKNKTTHPDPDESEEETK
ncbi:MAG: hypothetical protein GYB36_10720 [Alphaproteobacteria bacterium]|nr:hypothetical protein [Alphaproteobacteria bacterium]